MKFISFAEAGLRFCGKRVAIVGSAPSVLKNPAGFIDGHDVVVRVNNYKLTRETGSRTDVYYSFFGGSIKKTVDELKCDGVTLCWCKCPNAKPIESAWHEKMNKVNGIDFRYIYSLREKFWFCDTFIPTVSRFLAPFEALKQHIPSTGFSAIWDIITCRPREIYLTGFDFFESRIHNVNEPWREGDPNDPIGHRPDLELQWLRNHWATLPMRGDRKVLDLIGVDA